MSSYWFLLFLTQVFIFNDILAIKVSSVLIEQSKHIDSYFTINNSHHNHRRSLPTNESSSRDNPEFYESN